MYANLTAFTAASAIVGIAGLALAQSLPDQIVIEHTDRQVEQIRREIQAEVADNSAPKSARFDFGVYLTLSYLSVDDAVDRNHGLREYDLVGYAGVNVDLGQNVYVRGRTFYSDYNPGDFDNRSDNLQGRVEEAYYRFDLQKYWSADHHIESKSNATFTIGRQDTQWANGLVLWQYLDAARADFSYGPFDLTLLGGVTTSWTVDFDSLRPNFDNDTRRGFYGAMLGAHVGKHHPYIYALFQQDYNSDDPLTIGFIRTEHSYNSYYLGGGMNGELSDKWQYKSEMVFEGGSSLSRGVEFDPFLMPVQQQENSIQAGAADLQLDYLLHDSHKTCLSAEAIFATGDPDRLTSSNTLLGNKPGTHDMAFNAWGYVNTGLAFSPEVSNLMVLRLGATTYPLPDSRWFGKLQFEPSIFVLGKLRSDAPIDEFTGDDHYLGIEPDLAVNWPIRENLFFTGRYGVFIPGGAATESSGSRQFVYLAVTYAF